VVYPLALLGLILVIATCTPIVRWYGYRLAGKWPKPEGDVLIVLGGTYLEPEIIGEDSYWRSVYAVRLYKQQHFKQVFLVGSKVAENMRQFLAFQGVAPESIRLEMRSNSTHENAIYTSQMLANVPGRKVLMTSDYHMFRASRAFARAGVGTVPCPVPDAIKRSGHWHMRWQAFLDEALETGKILYYAARGWL